MKHSRHTSAKPTHYDKDAEHYDALQKSQNLKIVNFIEQAVIIPGMTVTRPKILAALLSLITIIETERLMMRFL